jgi:U-box domain
MTSIKNNSQTTGCSMVEIARKLKVDVPLEFICPITMDVMKRPLMTRSGFNYEKEAIMRWIRTTSDTCPLTRQVIHPSDLVPNKALEDRIAKWMFLYCLPSFPSAGDNNADDENRDDDVESAVILVGYVRAPERKKRYFLEKLTFLRSSN